MKLGTHKMRKVKSYLNSGGIELEDLITQQVQKRC